MSQTDITNGNRIALLDVLRGFAVSGILFCHFIKWHVSPFMDSMLRKDFSPLSDFVLNFNAIYLTDKFLFLFSFIFGISFSLQTVSLEKCTRHTDLWLLRRSLVLFLIGVIHYLFWFGDILTVYALLMLPVILIKRLNNKQLLLIGVFLLLNIPGILARLYLAGAAKSGGEAHVLTGVDERVAKLYQVVTHGNLTDNIRFNFSFIRGRLSFLFWDGTFSVILGFFCLGIYTARQKLLLKVDSFKGKFFYIVTAGLFLLFGIHYCIAYALLQVHFEPTLFSFIHSFLFCIQSIAGVATYFSLVVILSQNLSASALMRSLGNLGKMALTNYLMHTLIGLSLFYYAGFGLFLVTTPAMNVCIAAVVICFQMLYTNFWLRYFNYGPVEYLLRSGTMWKRIPLKKTKFENN